MGCYPPVMATVRVSCSEYGFDGSGYIAVIVPSLTAPRVSELGFVESPDVRVSTGWTEVVQPAVFGFESPSVFIPQAGHAPVDVNTYAMESPDVHVLDRVGAVVPVEASEMAFESGDVVVKIPCRVVVGPSVYGIG